MLEFNLQRVKEMLCCDSFLELEQFIRILSPYIANNVGKTPTTTARVILTDIIDNADKWKKFKELLK